MHGNQLQQEDKDARELLRLAQARFGKLITSLPVGMAIVRDDGVIEAANPCALTLFGYDDRELVSQSLQMLVVNAPWQNDLPAWYELNPDNTVELEGKIKGGDRVRIDVSVRVLDTDAQKRYVAVIQDVTRRYLAEELKQQFYRMINHDIKSPLAAVSLFLDSLSAIRRANWRTSVAGFSAASDNLTRVITLVQGLLELDRLESGTYNLNIETIDMRDLVNQAVAGTCELAAVRNISVTSQVDHTSVQGDFGRLLEVVVNLLSNAVEHSPEGRSIELTVQALDESLRLSVRDHGVGVPDSEKQRVFDKFQQAGTHSGKGHGLGLFICSEIVQQHNGTIGCTDAEGGGAIFWFQIPLMAQADSPRP